MDLTFAHYRNRFCMSRTYYAFGRGKDCKADGINMKVIELPDPPSKEQEEALIRGDVQAANLYLAELPSAQTAGRADHRSGDGMEVDDKGNGVRLVCADGPIKTPKDLEGRLIATHQGLHAIHQYLLRRVYWRRRTRSQSGNLTRKEKLLDTLMSGKSRRCRYCSTIFFFRGEVAAGVTAVFIRTARLGRSFTGLDELIKHIRSRAREDLIAAASGHQATHCSKHFALRSPTVKTIWKRSPRPLSRVTAVIRKRSLASARYPKVEFHFYGKGAKLAEAEMDLLVAVGQIPTKPRCRPCFLYEAFYIM